MKNTFLENTKKSAIDCKKQAEEDVKNVKKKKQNSDSE